MSNPHIPLSNLYEWGLAFTFLPLIGGMLWISLQAVSTEKENNLRAAFVEQYQLYATR